MNANIAPAVGVAIVGIGVTSFGIGYTIGKDLAN